jgi:hypothetical protein
MQTEMQVTLTTEDSRRAPDQIAGDINTDRPQTSLKDDQFNFEPVVVAIERTIRLAPADHGLVLHIDAEWGCGKSSALAMVKQIMHEQLGRSGRPKLMDFSPWWFTDREDLAKQFFQQLQLEFMQGQRLMTIREKIAQYSDQPGSGIGAGITAAVGAPVPGVDKVAATALKQLKPAEKSLSRLKREICEALARQSHRFVVFIDDIDRLAPSEVDQLFRVVKAVANFPNVVYVLAFDSTQVAASIEAQLKVDGRRYLEKIVQVSFPLPVPESQRIRELMVARISAIAGSDMADDLYTGSVLGAMAHLVSRPRDLARLTNTFACSYPALAGEVHPIDVAAMDLLRLVEPRVVEAIRDNPAAFHGNFLGLDQSGEKKARRDRFHSTWREGLTERRTSALNGLVGLLFPRLNAQSPAREPREPSRALLSAVGRVASPWGHAWYFHRRPADWVLTHAERNKILRLKHPDELLAVWERMLSRAQPGQFSPLHDVLIQIQLCPVSSDFAAGFVQSILRLGDRLYGAPFPSRFGQDPVSKPFLLCATRIERDPVGKILAAFEGATSLYGICQIAWHCVQRFTVLQEALGGAPAWMTDKAMGAITERAAQRLGDAARSDTLLNQPQVMELLGHWSRFDKISCEAWLRSKLTNDSTVVDVLRAFLCVGDHFGTDGPGTDTFSGNELEAILPPEVSMESLLKRLLALASMRGPRQELASQFARHIDKFWRDKSKPNPGAILSDPSPSDQPVAPPPS